MQPITRTLTLICAAVLLVVGPGPQGVAFAQEARPFATSGEYDRPAKMRHQSRSVVIASHGMVATSQPLAAQVGLDILRAGGTAADAAIATCAMMGLVEPMDAGIGGDLFAIYWDHKTQKLYGLNASGRSPYALNRDVFRSRGMAEIPEEGVLSWSVPGCVDGWDQLRQRFGTMTFKQLLAPTIQYADEGFPVTEVIAGLWANEQQGRHEICRHEGDVFPQRPPAGDR